MLDIKYVRQNLGEVKKMLAKRGLEIDVEKILELDAKRVSLLQKIEILRAERNKLAREQTTKARKKGTKIKEELKILEPKLKSIEENLRLALWQLPNMIAPNTPVGKSEIENIVVRQWGEPTKFDFQPKDHLELGKALDLIDFEKGAKIAGSQFYFLKNDAVLLEFALIRFALDFIKERGFKLFKTPDLAYQEIVDGIGFAPKGPETQVYNLEGQTLSLIATSEITLGGMHKDEILSEEVLPLKYGGFSHCFRTEAGGYGRYSKGLYRVHEFPKVEMFVYCREDQSEEMHQLLLSIEEEIYRELDLPHRVVEMCTGDLGAPAYRKFDVEVWIPGRNNWGEVTSTSNCTDYQARRLKIKYRRKADQQTAYVHTLNGTAMATPRTIITILENFQQKDGSILIPKALQEYMGKKEIRV